MKRNDCSIVQDLLPLYIEEMLQPDTVEYVEDHLSGCEICTATLAELKSGDTPVPAPDAKEIRKGDQQELQGLKKNIRLQYVTIAFAFASLILHFFPWLTPQRAEAQTAFGLPHLLFTAFPLYVSTVTIFHRKAYSRNMALVTTGLIIPATWVPLYLLIASLISETIKFFAGQFKGGYWPHDTLWSLLSATIHPALVLVSLFSLMLVVISLRNLWINALPPGTKTSSPFEKKLAFCSLGLLGCLLLLHLLPLVPSSKGYYGVGFFNLFFGGLPLYITAASAFCKVRNKIEAVYATALALALPLYAALPFLSQFFPAVLGSFTWMTPDEYAPLYCIPFLILSCLLSATAICSVWYQLKQQTKEN